MFGDAELIFVWVGDYRLNYDRSREAGWYYPEVFVEGVYREDPLFNSNFICSED